MKRLLFVLLLSVFVLSACQDPTAGQAARQRAEAVSAGLPDLVVASMTSTPLGTLNHRLTVVVSNTGKGTASASTLGVSRGARDDVGVMRPVPSLRAGQSHTVTVDVSYDNQRDVLVTAYADFLQVVTEENEDNNIGRLVVKT